MQGVTQHTALHKAKSFVENQNTQNIMSVNALKAAARMADIDSLYRVIKQDPYVLEYIDLVPFVDTPLHVAASVDLPGHIQFATEIMMLKPSFALKLNLEGLTPIHLALQNGCTTMALRLVHFNKDLVRSKMRGGLTPLHLASQYGDLGLLTGFLKVCPDSIEDETLTGETALHLAVKNNFEAFELLVKWLKEKTKTKQLEIPLLSRKDEDGNTILHIAALNNAKEAIQLLIKVAKLWMDFDAVNLMGKTALNLAHRVDIRIILGQVSKKRGRIGSLLLSVNRKFNQFRLKWSMKLTEENRNAYLVVATLVATSTYQAALSPPGGLHQTNIPSESIAEGTSVLSDIDFIRYSMTNTYAFLTSIVAIVALLPNKIFSIILLSSTFFLTNSFYTSITVISPYESTLHILRWAFGSSLVMSAITVGIATTLLKR